MDIKLSDVKEPRRAELWGIIIVTCFNFAFLIAAATHTADIGYNGYLAFAAFLLLFFAAEGGFLCVTYQLLKLLRARAGIDDLHDATVATNQTLAILQKGEETITDLLKEQHKHQEQMLKEMKEIKECFPCSKNLPPM